MARDIQIVNENFEPGWNNCVAIALSYLTPWSIKECYRRLGMKKGDDGPHILSYSKTYWPARAYLHCPHPSQLTTDGHLTPRDAILNGRASAGFILLVGHAFAFRDKTVFNVSEQHLDCRSDADTFIKGKGWNDQRFCFVLWEASPTLPSLYEERGGEAGEKLERQLGGDRYIHPF